MTQSISRRDFVRRTAAVTLAATATQTLDLRQTAVAGEFSGKIKKALKWGMVQEDLSVLDKFKLVKDLGFDGVEPSVGPLRKDKSLASELAKASESTGLPIHGVVNSSDPDIKTAIDLARMFGATSVLLVVRAPSSQQSYLENYQNTQEVIRRAISHAEKHEIQLLIENVWASFLNEPLGMARYIDELDSPMVGCYFDVGNNVRWGRPEHWIEVLGPRSKKLDIKEYSNKLQNEKGLGAGFGVKISEGSVDWQRVRQELAKQNYQGWATAEVRGGDRQRLADISKRMDAVLDL